MTIPQTVHYKAYRPPPLGAGDRGDVTLLFGGLTWKHEQLMQVALESLGYRCAPLPNIGKADLDCGKALIDAGACCPTAFTAGNLARHLRERVASEGREQVLRRYAFVTAGSCGPCRFGQYHESYAMALAGIGLEPLRMFLLDQYHLESQGQDGSAIDVNLPFTLAAVWALMIGDLLTDLEYMTRPYETLPGATATVLRQSVERMARALCEAPPQRGRWRTVAWYLASRHHTRALAEVRALWSGIEVDRLRVRPKVKITGEFWLQTHEGEGNHDIKRWLEREGAEVVPPPVTVWLDYVLAWFERSLDERRHKVDRYAMRKTLVVALRRWLRREYDRLRHALGDLPRELPRQEELAQLAAPFFHPGLEGGEGYMLIGKALHALRHRSAHMVCELSPYGCLPNTMSVGAMAQVLGRHPELLYAPIEIKGDAEVHALSRCQMVLAEARIRAQEEFDQALHASAMNMAQLRAVEAAHPALMRADYRIAPRGRAGTGA
ncbi:MAG: hypothetical protein IH627_07800, partial [Rubrivivax sp.]|nr:hypothetical protein [Rubrivivax sp.]